MQFLDEMRMNNLHSGSTETPFFKVHPDWQTAESPPVMDYKHEGVHKTLLDVTNEFLEGYDVDGIELDWLRWCHNFNPSEVVDSNTDGFHGSDTQATGWTELQRTAGETNCS